MTPASCSRRDPDLTRQLVEELLRTALTLERALASLVESLGEDAFGEEDNAAVLIDMAVGTCRPMVEAAGEQTCRAAIALATAIRDRLLGDLRAAARAARP